VVRNKGRTLFRIPMSLTHEMKKHSLEEKHKQALKLAICAAEQTLMLSGLMPPPYSLCVEHTWRAVCPSMGMVFVDGF
jgi:hypothetical protein